MPFFSIDRRIDRLEGSLMVPRKVQYGGPHPAAVDARATETAASTKDA
jgi:hypothetical protein